MKSLHLQNMKLIIFDFDGTIADTSPGILDAHRFALNAMGREIPSEETLRSIIGGNLLKTYVDIFGFDKSLAKEAVRIYRKRYAEVGIHRATIYDGFEDMLIFFKNSGYKIGLATLKAEIFAKTMLDEMGILEYFDAICGANAADELDKNELILKCKKMCAVDNKEIVMVGDSKNDAVGAMQCGCDFIAVTYGFGFKKMDELDDYPNIGVCSSVAEIQNLFLI